MAKPKIVWPGMGDKKKIRKEQKKPLPKQLMGTRIKLDSKFTDEY